MQTYANLKSNIVNGEQLAGCGFPPDNRMQVGTGVIVTGVAGACWVQWCKVAGKLLGAQDQLALGHKGRAKALWC